MRTRQTVWRALAGMFVFAVSVAPAGAQAVRADRRPVTIEAVGGANLATLTVPLAGLSALEDLLGVDVDFSVSRRAGLVGGVLVGVPAGNGVTFETGALVSVKGASTRLSVPGLGSGSSDVSMTYLDVPTLVRFRVARTSRVAVSLLAGSTVGFRLHAKTSVSGFGESGSDPATDEVAPVDVGLTVGGRIDLGRALVDVRYTHGLRNADRDSGPEGETLKHRVVSFMAGWRF